MSLAPLIPIGGTAEALRLLEQLPLLPTTTARVREVERLVAFAGGGTPVRNLISASGQIRPEASGEIRRCLEEGSQRRFQISPLFQVGSVKFFQAPQVRYPLRPGQGLEGSVGYGNYLIPTERDHHLQLDPLAHVGGVHLGVGSLQNLAYAGWANSGGLVFVDDDPFVAWSLPLILSMIPICRHPRLFLHVANRLFRKGSFVDSLFLAKVPKDFRQAFREHITNIRSDEWRPHFFSRFLGELYEGPRSFLASRESYDHVAGLIRRGAVAVIYGDLFAPETPDLVYAAMETFPEPVLRTVYLSNLFDYDQRESGSLLQLFAGPWTDPDGFVLSTSTCPEDLVSDFPPGIRGVRDWHHHQYRYYTLSMSHAVSILERHGRFGKPTPRQGRGIVITI